MEEERNQNKNQKQNKISEFNMGNEVSSIIKLENAEADEIFNVDSITDIVMIQYSEAIKDLVDL